MHSADGYQQSTLSILPPELLSCSPQLLIEIVMDGSSSETSRQLEMDGVVVDSSSVPYDEGLSSTQIQNCIEDGTYIFTVFDLEGDGMDGAYNVIFLLGCHSYSNERII